MARFGYHASREQFAPCGRRYPKSSAARAWPQLDDVFGEADQVNVPATSFENANRRRKYRMTLEEIASGQDAWRWGGRLLELRNSDRQDSHAA